VNPKGPAFHIEVSQPRCESRRTQLGARAARDQLAQWMPSSDQRARRCCALGSDTLKGHRVRPAGLEVEVPGVQVPREHFGHTVVAVSDLAVERMDMSATTFDISDLSLFRGSRHRDPESIRGIQRVRVLDVKDSTGTRALSLGRRVQYQGTHGDDSSDRHQAIHW
jgi:hypothetical protein